jgi:hypothetical protein
MEQRIDLDEIIVELEIADMLPGKRTPEQEAIVTRVYKGIKEGALGSNGMSGALYLALGITGPFSRDRINTRGVNSTFENGLGQTDTPTTGDVCAWHSNPFVYVQDGFHTSGLRHLGVVLGVREGVFYIAHQVGSRICIDPEETARQKVDAQARTEFPGRYEGILAVRYHPLAVVSENRRNYLRR